MAGPELLSAAVSPAPYDPGSYWAGMHSSHPGQLAAVGYAPLGEGFNRAAYVLRRKAVLRLLARNPAPPEPSILEAAVGTGAYAPLWRSLRAAHWVGLDIAGEAVEHCRRNYPGGEFLRQDLAASVWPDPSPASGQFDLVTAIDVLYHLVDDAAFEAALANLAARVRRGGALLVSDVFVSGERRTAPHVRRRSIEAYLRVLGPGLRLVDREPVFAILADPLPRSRFNLADHAMLAAWKLMARSLRGAPPAARDVLGAGVVHFLWPFDALLRRLGAARGVNLELALFLRT
jgi:SAM-dependent methyltransferase